MCNKRDVCQKKEVCLFVCIYVCACVCVFLRGEVYFVRALHNNCAL